jgi:hypothetical protein
MGDEEKKVLGVWLNFIKILLTNVLPTLDPQSILSDYRIKNEIYILEMIRKEAVVA